MPVTIIFNNPNYMVSPIHTLHLSENYTQKNTLNCEFSGICSATVAVSVVLVCDAMSLGDWRLMCEGHHCLDMSHTNHSVTQCHI
jgi:hypothetical protein